MVTATTTQATQETSVVGTVATSAVTVPPPTTIAGAVPIATADFRGRTSLTVLAVAYRLGADADDLDELRKAAIPEAACGFIDVDDLDQPCSIAIDDMGACSLLDHEDLEKQCEVGFEPEGSYGVNGCGRQASYVLARGVGTGTWYMNSWHANPFLRQSDSPH